MRYRLRTLLILLAVGLFVAWLSGAIAFAIYVRYTSYPPSYDLRMIVDSEEESNHVPFHDP